MKRPIAASDDLSQFDVVVVPFPYANRLAVKRRPALVLSNAGMHREFGLVWLAMITSAENRRLSCDIEIGDLTAAALPAQSLVRPVKIATVETTRIVRRLGNLSAEDATAVKAKLTELMSV
jgi:mRNA interferase MazF